MYYVVTDDLLCFHFFGGSCHWFIKVVYILHLNFVQSSLSRSVLGHISQVTTSQIHFKILGYSDECGKEFKHILCFCFLEYLYVLGSWDIWLVSFGLGFGPIRCFEEPP